jgi:tripeptide aminopeptidase
MHKDAPMDNLQLKNFLLDSFARYTRIDTTSQENAGKLPSSANQRTLAELALAQMVSLGYQDGVIDDTATVIATLPANSTRRLPTLAFVVHLDTAPGCSGRTRMQVHENYAGGDLVLDAAQGVMLSPASFPELENYIGDDIITSDGASLLGADDKAALAEVLAGLELLRASGVEHGAVKVVLLPDEEVGLLGAKALDVSRLQADMAYTLDCCALGEYVVENWNAGSATIRFTGQSAHPMSAKGKMKNALIMAHELVAMLPPQERPEHTEKKEGYFWVKKIEGDTSAATLVLDVREFDDQAYIGRMNFLRQCAERLAQKYGAGAVDLVLQDNYANVRSSLVADRRVLDCAVTAMLRLGILPRTLEMRGGYDGAVLAQKGLPTGNVFTGAHNFHSIYEYLPLQSMMLAARMVCTLVQVAAEGSRNE